MMNRAALKYGVGAAAFLLALAPGHAQDNGSPRAVTIIEDTAAPSSLIPDATPAPSMTTGEIRATSIKSENPAGLDLTILPDVELAAGSTMTFRVATRRQGYLILVDVDPDGKLTQIYPNRHSLQTRENNESLNLMKPGHAMTVPSRDNPYAGFEFVASPPVGVGMIVALLSDRPVHLLDLPDIAPPRTGQAAFDQLYEVARQLRVVRDDAPGTLQEPKWSFEAKLYAIR